MKSKDDLKIVYKYLNGIIVRSDEYKNLLYSLTSDEIIESKIKELFKGDISLFEELMSDVVFIFELTNKLGKENDFAKCAISSVLTDNAIESVINVKFIETLYGNPLKNDISLNDVLFLILESVIGLDTIIMSFYDRNIITLRVNEIMKNKKGDFEGFNVIINNIYNGLSDCQSYDEIITGLSDYKDELADYIQGGLDMQLYEIMNNPQGSYDNYNMLFARINDLIPKINAKKM